MIHPRYMFPIPSNIRQCKDRLHELYCTIEKINVDLSDPLRTDRNRQPLTCKEYKDWKHRALAKLSMSRVEYAQLTAWLKDQRRELQALDVGVEDPNNPIELIRHGRDILRRAASQYPEAGRLSDVYDQYLMHSGESNGPR